MSRRIVHVLILLFGFALFDALIHGGIAAAMQAQGAWNQMVSDFYQLGYAIAMATVLLICYVGFVWKGEVWATLALLFGFVEDTLYFVFMPLVNPVIRVISRGQSITSPAQGCFPITSQDGSHGLVV